MDGADKAVAVAVIVVMGGIELADLETEEMTVEEDMDNAGVGL